MKQNESMKLKESVKSAKQELTDHHQNQYSPSSLLYLQPKFRVKIGLNNHQRTHNSRMNT